MSDLAVINLTNPSPWIHQPLPGGKDSLCMLFDTLKQISEISQYLVIVTPDFKIDIPQGSRPLKIRTETSWNEQSLLSVLIEESKGYENILHVWGDAPLLDLSIVTRLYTLHREGFAQYTFADGYPFGFAPEILKSSLIEELPRLISPQSLKKSLQRDLFFQIIQRDINSFDIETEISQEDFRLYRLSFTLDCKSNFLLVSGFLEEGKTTCQEILPFIKERPDLLRTRPGYFLVQISDSCPQQCSYCPRSQDADFRFSIDGSGGTFMETKKFRKLCSDISDFSSEAVISLSLTGEPSLHPNLVELVETAFSFSGLKVLIETSGLGWNSHDLFDREWDKDRFFIIVSLDALDPDLYSKLRGEGMDEAVAFANKALAKWPDSVWLQGVRMNENEEDLEKFFRYWKESTDNIIIQKYSSFAGMLPDRKVTDLSPLDRFPCWALKREMSISINGDVLLCRNITDKSKNVLGNCFKDTLEVIWNKGTEAWLSHSRGEYRSPCNRCDEYYVYNF